MSGLPLITGNIALLFCLSSANIVEAGSQNGDDYYSLWAILDGNFFLPASKLAEVGQNCKYEGLTLLLADLLSSLPLCEFDGCDFPLGGIVLESITLQTPTRDLGRHIGVLDVVEAGCSPEGCHLVVVVVKKILSLLDVRKQLCLLPH